MAILPITPTSPSEPTQRARQSESSRPPPSHLDETVNVVGAANDPVASPDKQPPSREAVREAMQEMQKSLPAMARNLQFSIDEQTGRTVVKVVDATTSEVIRQFPSEELLSIAQALDKFSGLLLKQKV